MTDTLHHTPNRRRFIQQLSLAAASLPLAAGWSAAEARTGAEVMHQPQTDAPQRPLGIALVGLGYYSEGQLAPALQQTKHCRLAGIVTGSPGKAERWKREYQLSQKNVYNYDNFDDVRNNDEIDIIYVVLPNFMHAEYVIRAAAAGKHVICEKPMAISVEECDRMIEACARAGKKLSIGYRLHFEPHHQELMRLGREKPMGPVQVLGAKDGASDVNGWRLEKEMAGGGPLMDLGIYCVQGCRYSTGLEPLAVRAQEIPKTDPEKFKTIEEGLDFLLEFPNGITADCRTSYTESMNNLRVVYQSGWAELEPAYAYEGIRGETSAGKMNYPQVNQQARQMDDFALAILEGRPSPVPGEMGRQDLRILEAIYRAMRSGKPETL